MSHEAEEGIEAMDLVDSDTILEGGRLMDDEAPQELDEPLAKLALDNIRDTIDRLYRLSFRIRNPAKRLGFSQAKQDRLMAEYGTDLTESVIAIDLKHVDDLITKHLKMPPEESRNHFLVLRLAKTNTIRRQQFALWRSHRSKVEQPIERTGGSRNIELHNDPGATSQQILNTASQPSTATQIDASICLDDSQYVLSSSAHTALFKEDQWQEIIILRLPEKVRGKDFECPYCYMPCPGRISDGPAWERHVYRDLRPYICTHEYCTEADQLYDSITDWIAHEYHNHKDAMRYPGKICSDEFLASQQEDTSRPPGLDEVCREQCPICDEEEPSVSHIGHHLQKIAAFALPRLTILDTAPGNQDSNDANLESDNDSAEMFSEFELEDAENLSYQNPSPTSFPQNHNEQYHPILGPDRQSHANQHSNQPIDTSNLDFCRVLYEITPENKSSTVGIDLEAKPGDLVAIISKSGPPGDGSESWLCRAHDGRQGFLPLMALEIVRKGAEPQAQIKAGEMANTMTTPAATRANLPSSNAVKQLDHSSQRGLPIRDYRDDLDLEGSEQDAGQWSEIISQQASVSESLTSSKPDGYDPSQPPEDRVVESQYQDMMKKQKAKHKETTLAQAPSVQSKTIPMPLSFYVRIEPISPDYGCNGQSIRHAEAGYWMPPDRPNELTKGQGHTLLLRWEGGRTTIVPANDPIRDADLNGYIYRAATIFTQQPDTPHLLVVPFDARIRSVQEYGRGWQYITFDHNRVGNSDSSAYYSYVSDRGAEQRIAAPALLPWMDQLLSPWYDCVPRHASRTQAGLIGQLPLLFALAAFSAPPKSLGVLLSSIQPGKWMHHNLPTGHDAERGMVVTVYLDPLNPQCSTPRLLNGLEDGEFGPFYGP